MRYEDFADAVHVEINDASVAKIYGKAMQNTNRQRRRIMWYAPDGEIDSPSQAGGRIDPNDGEEARSPAVLERQERIVCKVFAESRDTTEQLLEILLVAISKTAANNGAMLADARTSYEFEDDQVSKRTPHYVLTFPIRFPVRDEVKALVTITDEELFCEIDEDLDD